MMTIHHITFRISSFNCLNPFISAVIRGGLKNGSIRSLFLVLDLSVTPTVLALLALAR